MKLYAILIVSVAIPLLAQTVRPLTADDLAKTDADSASPLVDVNAQQRHQSQQLDQQAGGLPSQKIGPGDLLTLSVSDCPELSRNFRVSPNGTLPLPLLKERIVAAGKEAPEVELEVAGALMRDEILVRPVVSVSVAEYRSVPVSITGAVKRPTTFQAVGKVTLLEAIAKAEGLTQEAGAEILITRTTSDAAASSQLVERISVRSLMVDADPAANIRLLGGEEIRVPPAGKFFVAGSVKKPGPYSVHDGGSSVFEALAMCEGPLNYHGKQAFIYRREGGKNQSNEIPVELDKILNRKSADVQLMANDILFVPDSPRRRLTAQTIDRILSFGAGTASGVLIFH